MVVLCTIEKSGGFDQAADQVQHSKMPVITVEILVSVSHLPSSLSCFFSFHYIKFNCIIVLK